jgi:hypothetical protein
LFLKDLDTPEEVKGETLKEFIEKQGLLLLEEALRK